MNIPREVMAVALRHIVAVSEKLQDEVQNNNSGLPVVLCLTIRLQGVTRHLTGRLGLIHRADAPPGFSWDQVKAAFPIHAGPIDEFANSAPPASYVCLLITVQTEDAVHCSVVGIPCKKPANFSGNVTAGKPAII